MEFGFLQLKVNNNQIIDVKKDKLKILLPNTREYTGLTFDIPSNEIFRSPNKNQKNIALAFDGMTILNLPQWLDKDGWQQGGTIQMKNSDLVDTFGFQKMVEFYVPTNWLIRQFYCEDDCQTYYVINILDKGYINISSDCFEKINNYYRIRFPREIEIYGGVIKKEKDGSLTQKVAQISLDNILDLLKEVDFADNMVFKIPRACLKEIKDTSYVVEIPHDCSYAGATLELKKKLVELEEDDVISIEIPMNKTICLNNGNSTLNLPTNHIIRALNTYQELELEFDDEFEI